jgi:general secretion pathway protein C
MRADLAPILDFAPFGVPATTPVIVTDDSPVGETSLQLRLLGVTLAAPASFSRAMIQGGETPIASYAPGSFITASAQLSEVFADHVVLLVDGKAELLSFPVEIAAGPQAGTGSTLNLGNLAPQDGGNGQTIAANPNDADAVIARYRTAIQNDAYGVVERLGLEPTDEGYRISASASPGVRQAGFRPGDIVTTVNGKQVGKVEDDQLYFDEVAAAGQATVSVVRGGQTIFMTFPLR